MKPGLLLMLTLALAACGDRSPTVIDGSSADRFEQSTAKARRDLPIADRLLFDAALKSPPGGRFAMRDVDRLRREAYDGMTAADVVAHARSRGL